MWIGLTGSPRIGGILYDDQTSVEGRAVPEHIIDERRGGLEVVVEERYRLVGEVVWRGLQEGKALALASDLAFVFDLDLRTVAAGDPEWGTELRVTVRRTSDLMLTTPLDGVDAETDRPLAEHRAEWRSVRIYTRAQLGVVTGGFKLLASTIETNTIESYGEGTIEDGPSQAVMVTDPRTGQPVNLTIESYRLGTPAVAAARTERTDRNTVIIHTRRP